MGSSCSISSNSMSHRHMVFRNCMPALAICACRYSRQPHVACCTCGSITSSCMQPRAPCPLYLAVSHVQGHSRGVFVGSREPGLLFTTTHASSSRDCPVYNASRRKQCAAVDSHKQAAYLGSRHSPMHAANLSFTRTARPSAACAAGSQRRAWSGPDSAAAAPTPRSVQIAADAFLREYSQAGLVVSTQAAEVLRAWFVRWRRLSGACAAPQTGSRQLPALLMPRPGRPLISIFWDLDNLRPRALNSPSTNGSSSSSSGGGGAVTRRPYNDSGAGGGGVRGGRSGSRMQDPGSMPPDADLDMVSLVTLMDNLAHVLGHYGYLHSAALFGNEATFASVPGMRLQALQLATWAGVGDGGGAADTGESDAASSAQQAATPSSAAAAAAAHPSMSLRQQPRMSPHAKTHHSSTWGTTPCVVDRRTGTLPLSKAGGTAALSSEAPVCAHMCPLCSHFSSSHQQLLQHFLLEHQLPIMSATAGSNSLADCLHQAGSDGGARYLAARYELLTRGIHLDQFFSLSTADVEGAVGGLRSGDGDNGSSSSGGVGGISVHVMDVADQAVDACISAEVMQCLRVWEQQADDVKARAMAGRPQKGRSSTGMNRMTSPPPAPRVVCIVSNDSGYSQLLEACERRGVASIAVAARPMPYPGASLTLDYRSIQKRMYALRRP